MDTLILLSANFCLPVIMKASWFGAWQLNSKMETIAYKVHINCKRDCFIIGLFHTLLFNYCFFCYFCFIFRIAFFLIISYLLQWKTYSLFSGLSLHGFPSELGKTPKYCRLPQRDSHGQFQRARIKLPLRFEAMRGTHV